MKKKNLLKIINNENDLNNFLSTTNEEHFLLGIQQCIESKNINALKKFIEYNNSYKNNKLKDSIFNKALEFAIFQDYYDSISYLIQNKNFNINEEIVINSIKNSVFPPALKSLSIILKNTKFKKEHFTILVALYLINTNFIDKENISDCLNEIYLHYNFSSKEIYDFLFLNNVFSSLQFQKNSGFNNNEFSFFDFIISFDKDNYIIHKLPEYSKYIDDFHLFYYVDHLNKIKYQEMFDKF